MPSHGESPPRKSRSWWSTSLPCPTAYRFSKLRGAKVTNPQKEEIGELDDLIIGKDRVLFAIIEVGGFLGIGGKLIAAPYTSLQISGGGKRIVLPGASKEDLKALPEFKYR